MAATLFLSGDVMLGRGVDQVLPRSCPPRLYEPWVTSALDYVEMAESRHGPIPAPVGYDWIWGDLLEVLGRRAPDARIVNLETAVTTHDEAAPEKGIHYRTHPDNVRALGIAGIDVCVLANNHVLDWGREGLLETLDALEGEGIRVAGAGRDRDLAAEPAVVPFGAAPSDRPAGEVGEAEKAEEAAVAAEAADAGEAAEAAEAADAREAAEAAEAAEVGSSGSGAERSRAGSDGRLLVVGLGGPDCGIPPAWAAAPRRPGVHVLADYSAASVDAVARSVERVRMPGDLVVASIHWGPNWGYDIPRKHRRFGRALIDEAGVHLVHGHSSHHPMGAERYRGHLILYGCGDLITDYEGISGHEEFRGDLGVAYFPTLAPDDGRLLALELEPLRMRRFQLVRPPAADRAWLLGRLRREYGRLGLEVEAAEAGAFSVG